MDPKGLEGAQGKDFLYTSPDLGVFQARCWYRGVEGLVGPKDEKLHRFEFYQKTSGQGDFALLTDSKVRTQIEPELVHRAGDAKEVLRKFLGLPGSEVILIPLGEEWFEDKNRAQYYFLSVWRRGGKSSQYRIYRDGKVEEAVE